MNPILVTASTFADELIDARLSLKERGMRLVKNPYARKLSSTELRDWLLQHKPAGVLAGVEEYSNSLLAEMQPFLRVISRIGVGVDNIDLDSARTLGIRIFRTEESVTPAVVELTIGLIFDLARRISWHDRMLRGGRWERGYGSLVSGKTLSVVGCGRIGKQVCLKMQQLGCAVQAFDSFENEDFFIQNNIRRVSTLEELVATSDILSIHVPLTLETRNMFSEDMLALAKPELLLINTSRGGIIDEKALCQYLRSGKLLGAALDVFEEEPYLGPLSSLDNVVLTPHIASYARETRAQMEREALNNLLLGLEVV